VGSFIGLVGAFFYFLSFPSIRFKMRTGVGSFIGLVGAFFYFLSPSVRRSCVAVGLMRCVFFPLIRELCSSGWRMHNGDTIDREVNLNLTELDCGVLCRSLYNKTEKKILL